MASGKEIQKKGQSHFTPTPATGMFQSRPFAKSAELETATPEVQTKVEPTTLGSDRLSRIEVSPPSPIQPKLAIGAPGDKYEQEADTVARKVVKQISAPTPPDPHPNGGDASIQRQFSAPSISRLVVQRREAIEGGEASSDLERTISQAKSSGVPLAAPIRRQMEGAFGTDFSGVRIHANHTADTLNRDLSSRAFTTGNNIFFKRGEYNPGSSGGKELLAHELTHVVQQGGGSDGQIQRMLSPDEFKTKTEPGFVSGSSRNAIAPGRKFIFKGSKTESYEMVSFEGKKTQSSVTSWNEDEPVTVIKSAPNPNNDNDKEDGLLFFFNDNPSALYWAPKNRFEEVGFLRDYDEIKEPELGAKYIQDENGNRVKIKHQGEFKESNESLFPPEGPKPDHVLQGELGDCYLLAALASLAKTEPNYIKGMMRDNGDAKDGKGGTVTVRLYDVTESNTQVSSSENINYRNKIAGKEQWGFAAKPIYIKVNKSVVQENGTDKYAKDYLWVQMVEKAYAASGFSGELVKRNNGSYENIQGGYVAYAMEVLTGKASEVTRFYNNKDNLKTDPAPLLKKIDRALKNGQTVGAPSRPLNKTEKSEKTVSTGESMYQGIATEHSYSIIDVKVQDQLIQLRNPWGKFGATYEKNQLKSDYDNKTGEVWLKVDDFIERFTMIEIGGKVENF